MRFGYIIGINGNVVTKATKWLFQTESILEVIPFRFFFSFMVLHFCGGLGFSTYLSMDSSLPAWFFVYIDFSITQRELPSSARVN